MIVVSGASGFIGQHLTRHDEDVWRIGRWHTPAELRDALPETIDRCIHLAWYASAPDYLTNESENSKSLKDSMEFIRAVFDRGCRHLTVAGTCAEYGPASAPLGEEDAIDPQSPYGIAKVRLRMWLESEGLPHAWARLFHVVGRGESETRLVPTVVRGLIDRQFVALSPGEQVRDFVAVEDAAKALAHLSEVGAIGHFNVGTGMGSTIRRFLTDVAETMGADTSLLGFGQRPYRPDEPMYLVANTQQINATGWWPNRANPWTVARSVGLAPTEALFGGALSTL